MVARITNGTPNAVGPEPPPAGMSPSAFRERLENPNPPTQLCRWSIHVRPIHYTSIPEPAVDEPYEYDQLDPRSFREWAAQERSTATPFVESIQESLTSGAFSFTPPDELSISTEMLSQSIQSDPEVLQVDAWKIAIMAGNNELLSQMFENDGHTVPDRIEEIHPIHLAASFLDGGNTCCGMITLLSDVLGNHYAYHHDRDQLGHTVLDTLMVNILRSHTTVAPEQVNSHFDPPHRFPGEEKDICGRWDADTPEIRALFRHGYARIPTRWKHAFCHTSVQAIYHSAIAVLASPASRPIDALSGLFIRRCTDCGAELKLGPLHALVVVAFYLAHNGMPGETLFGALALLICLMRLGADASLEVEVSVDAILRRQAPDKCSHKPMNASDLMKAVPSELLASWSDDCRTGWACIIQVLQLPNDDEEDSNGGDRDGRGENSASDSDMVLDDISETNSDAGNEKSPCFPSYLNILVHSEWLKLPCGNSKLGSLWAAIQVELLTYRRINEGDPWVSERFLMASLKDWLEHKSPEFRTPLVDDGLMEKHSRCGWFLLEEFLHPTAEEVCKSHFMNMDVYGRATFLRRVELPLEWLEVQPVLLQ